MDTLLDRSPHEVSNNTPSIVETVQLGRINIQALPLEHKSGIDQTVQVDGQTSTLKDQVSSIVAEADGVIFEYLPHEIREKSPTKPEQYFNYFGPFEQACIDQKKEAFALDPAYDISFAVANNFSQMTSGLTGTLVSVLGATLGKKQSEPVSLTRRRFMGLTGSAAAGVAVFGTTNMLSHATEDTMSKPIPFIPNEAHFRRCVIARGLIDLSERPEMAGKNLLLLYPPVHWEGIKALLANRERLDRDFAIYKKLYPLDDKFFVAREYIADTNGQMALKEQRSIN
ncbi:MAG: twin-arginine translocation signal domain-containing protein [Microgenomates group bacterium]